MKRAILLVAFGTGVSEAQKAFDHIDARVKESFPEDEVRWAFTSRFIRAKLNERGHRLHSPEAALVRLADERYTHVAVLSLHVMPGEEFHRLYRNASLFARMYGGLQRVVVARPLLSSVHDMIRVARAMLSCIPPERNPRDAVLFMGHGNRKHPADAMYPALNYIFHETDPNIHLATVSGYPSLEDILPKLRRGDSNKVYLVPFMAVAGEHIRRDMAGEEPESWKSVLSRSGHRCEVVMKGMAESAEVVDVWMDHLRSALAEL